MGDFLAFLCGAIAMTGFAVIGNRAAYFNGVVDGYGYSREPRCPGYRLAGEHLRRTMAHRWPELAEEDGTEMPDEPAEDG